MTREIDLDDLLGSRHQHATFHDAVLQSLSVNYAAQTASLAFRIPAGIVGNDLRYYAGTLKLEGLLFLVIEPPEQPYSYVEPSGAWITADGSYPDPKVRSQLKMPPSLPHDSFVHYFFASDWNAFIFVGATSASFTWQE